MSENKMIEGSTKFLCAAIELAMGRIDLCKCSKCGSPRDNGWMCGECGDGWCDPITEDSHIDAAILAISSHDKLTDRVVELETALRGLLDSPHTRLARHMLIEASESDIDIAIKALQAES